MRVLIAVISLATAFVGDRVYLSYTNQEIGQTARDVDGGQYQMKVSPPEPPGENESQPDPPASRPPARQLPSVGQLNMQGGGTAIDMPESAIGKGTVANQVSAQGAKTGVHVRDSVRITLRCPQKTPETIVFSFDDLGGVDATGLEVNVLGHLGGVTGIEIRDGKTRRISWKELAVSPSLQWLCGVPRPTQKPDNPSGK